MVIFIIYMSNLLSYANQLIHMILKTGRVIDAIIKHIIYSHYIVHMVIRLSKKKIKLIFQKIYMHRNALEIKPRVKVDGFTFVSSNSYNLVSLFQASA